MKTSRNTSIDISQDTRRKTSGKTGMEIFRDAGMLTSRTLRWKPPRSLGLRHSRIGVPWEQFPGTVSSLEGP